MLTVPGWLLCLPNGWVQSNSLIGPSLLCLPNGPVQSNSLIGPSQMDLKANCCVVIHSYKVVPQFSFIILRKYQLVYDRLLARVEYLYI